MMFEASICLIFMLLKFESPTRAIIYYYRTRNETDFPIFKSQVPIIIEKLDNLIVDFESTHFVSTINFEVEDKERNPEVRIFSIYYGWMSCGKVYGEDSNDYKCNMVGRIVHIEIIGGPSQIKTLETNFTKLMLDNYIGCFDVENATLHSEDNLKPETCGGKCESPFFGVLEGQCLCVKNLTELVPVDPAKCNKPCFSNLEPCGGIKHFSVYSKVRTQKNMADRSPGDKDWRCIIERKEGCIINVEKGRKGLNGEYIDCDNMNGNCGDMKCDVVITSGFGINVCSCRDGYYSDNDFNCHDIDECNKNQLLCKDQYLSRCVNNRGSYKCDCPLGFKDTSTQCIDIDECIANTKCNFISSKCKNSPGSYYCECNDGYRKEDDFVCIDINECEDKDKCDQSTAECKNNDGGYNCVCKRGFKKVNASICKEDTFFLADFYQNYFHVIVIVGLFILAIILAKVRRCFAVSMNKTRAEASSVSDNRSRVSGPSVDVPQQVVPLPPPASSSSPETGN